MVMGWFRTIWEFGWRLLSLFLSLADVTTLCLLLRTALSPYFFHAYVRIPFPRGLVPLH